MRIMHLYHSGFYVELAQCALLFDYYEGTIPPIPADKPLYVFASHVHQDHFSFSVFTKEELRAHPQVSYFLSNDIKRKYNRNFFLRRGVTETQYERVTFLKAGEEICMHAGMKKAEHERMPESDREYGEPGQDTAGQGESWRQNAAEQGESLEQDTAGQGESWRQNAAGQGEKRGQDCCERPDGAREPCLRVKTLRSTDAGVAFIVDAGGRHIYHAGDLNWWSWEGETERDEREMELAYKGEIAKLSDRAFDVACLPLDGRQGERFALGFDWFMRHVETKYAYPMHYWDDEEVVKRLLSSACSEPYREKIVKESELVL